MTTIPHSSYEQWASPEPLLPPGVIAMVPLRAEPVGGGSGARSQGCRCTACSNSWRTPAPKVPVAGVLQDLDHELVAARPSQSVTVAISLSGGSPPATTFGPWSLRWVPLGHAAPFSSLTASFATPTWRSSGAATSRSHPRTTALTLAAAAGSVHRLPLAWRHVLRRCGVGSGRLRARQRGPARAGRDVVDGPGHRVARPEHERASAQTAPPVRAHAGAEG